MNIMHQVKTFALAVLLTVTVSSVAQPPVGPDPRPKSITPDDLDKAIGGPSLVSLKYADARPEEVFTSLAKQAGVHLHAYESTALLKKLPPMSVELKDVPCVLAAKTLCAKLGLNFMLVSSDPILEKNPTGLTLRVQKADDPQLRMEGPTLVRGPFVIIATNAQRARTISLSEKVSERPAVEREDYLVDFVLMADPKLLNHDLLGTPTFFDSDGWKIRSIDRENPWQTRSNLLGTPRLEWRFSAHRRVAANDTPKGLSLKTSAQRLLVTTKTETWEIKDILNSKNVAKEITLAEGKRKYTLLGVTGLPNTDVSRRGEMFDVQLQVSGVGITKGKWSGWPEFDGYSLIKSFRLVDAQGADYAPYGHFEFKKLVMSETFWSGAGRGNDKAAMEKPAKAIWRLPTEIRAIDIPIEFSNLPLP